MEFVTSKKVITFQIPGLQCGLIYFFWNMRPEEDIRFYVLSFPSDSFETGSFTNPSQIYPTGSAHQRRLYICPTPSHAKQLPALTFFLVYFINMDGGIWNQTLQFLANLSEQCLFIFETSRILCVIQSSLKVCMLCVLCMDIRGLYNTAE